MGKTFDELTITDDYMFCIVMQDKSICTTVLNMVLAQTIGPISDITYQKTFNQIGYAKGVRLDVWVKDSSGNVYDVEMQATNKQDLAKRLRYYQSVIDVSTLEKGAHYTDLPHSFILFFCPFDYVEHGLPVYTFKTICSEDNTIILQDGITKVIINSTAAQKAVDPELKAFLQYMNGTVSDSPFIGKLDRLIKELKANEEKRREYMLLQAFEMDARRDGMQQGMQQGIQQGIQQGKSLGLAEGKSLGLAEGKSLGLAEGSRRKALETAKNLLAMGLSIENIAKATGLSVQEVESARSVCQDD